MKKLFTAAVVILVSIILASTANATILGTTTIQNHSNGLSDQGQLWGGGLNGGTYYTGVYSWINNTVGSTGLGAQVPNWGFCIELTQGTVDGLVYVIPLEEAPLPVTAITPMGSSKADAIRELWGRNFATIAGNAQLGEAFGVAVWEIIYETESTWDVSNGAGFHAASIEQAAAANSWLTGLNGDKEYFANDLAAISTLGGQDFLVQIPGGIPEPATVALLGLGALSLVRSKK